MRVRIAASCAPGGDPSTVRSFAFGAADDLRVALSVQTEALGSRGLVRGRGPAFAPGIRNGVAVRLTAAADQRIDVLPVRGSAAEDSHCVRFARSRVDRRAVAVTGCGNLLMNPGVAGTVVDGRICTTPPGRLNSELRIRDGRRGEPVLSLDRGGLPRPPFEPTGPDDWSVSGPLLVQDGAACPILAAEFDDPRHVCLFPWFEAAPGIRVDFGLDRLLRDSVLYEAAARGQAVELALMEDLPADDATDARMIPTSVDPRRLVAALSAKGYRAADAVREPGTFKLGRDRIEIAFLPGVYPHHALALDGDGRPWSVLVSGKSNRSGTTVRDLSEALVAAGARDAVLLDNGGDVGLLLRDEAADDAWRYELEPSEADRAASWRLRACLVWHRPT